MGVPSRLCFGEGNSSGGRKANTFWALPGV
jgi:hypothetical protein